MFHESVGFSCELGCSFWLIHPSAINHSLAYTSWLPISWSNSFRRQNLGNSALRPVDVVKFPSARLNFTQASS